MIRTAQASAISYERSCDNSQAPKKRPWSVTNVGSSLGLFFSTCKDDHSIAPIDSEPNQCYNFFEDFLYRVTLSLGMQYVLLVE